jgi:ribosomal protein S18 acetylase RimI-like enzyme
VRIRDANKSDVDFILRLGDLEFTRYSGDGAARCLMGMKVADALTIVAEDESTCQQLGFAIVAPWNGQPYLFAVATIPERRRTGVGKVLVEECILRAQSTFGRSDIFLHVAESNHAARSLFASLRFQETPEPRGYPMRWTGVPDIAIRMVRAVPVATSCAH